MRAEARSHTGQATQGVSRNTQGLRAPQMNRRQACSGLVRSGSIRPSQAPSGLIISGRNLRMHDGQDVLAQGDPDAASVGSVAAPPPEAPSPPSQLAHGSACLRQWSLRARSSASLLVFARWETIYLDAGGRPCHGPTGFGALQSPSARSLPRPWVFRATRVASVTTGTRPWSVELEPSKRRTAGPVVLACPASALPVL